MINTILNQEYNVYSIIYNNNVASLNYPTLYFKWNNNFSNTFYNASQLNLNLSSLFRLSYSTVENLDYTFYNCGNISGEILQTPRATSMAFTYFNCKLLSGSPYVANTVTNLAGAFYNCGQLNGTAKMSNQATNLYGTYYNCHNIIGRPVVSPVATNTAYTYTNCYLLSGMPQISNNSLNMAYMYYNCGNIVYSPSVGGHTKDMAYAYFNCQKLSGTINGMYNIYNFTHAYYNCFNIYGCIDLKYQGNQSVNAENAFYNRNNQQILIIDVVNSPLWNNWFYNVGTFNGTKAEWILKGSRYYNQMSNTQIRFKEDSGVYLNAFKASSLDNYNLATTIYIEEEF